MLRGAVSSDAGEGIGDPFLPLANNVEIDEGMDVANLDDSAMSEWFSHLSPDAIANGANDLLSVTELFDISGSGLIGAESDQELKSPEKFQDLRFTSTPKSKAAVDSGFAEETSANKSIEYKVVLNDITDKLKADFFTSLTDVCEISPGLKVSNQDPALRRTPVRRPLPVDENKGAAGTQNKGFEVERNVGIIRRRIRTLPSTIQPTNILARTSSLPMLTPAPPGPPAVPKEPRRPRKKKPIPNLTVPDVCNKCKGPIVESGETEISEAELLYYTGIKKHKSALGMVKFMRLPEHSRVTAFKRILITMMKLKFDFPYEDLGFRLREATSVVKSVIKTTSATMAVALTDFVPWLEPPTSSRTAKKCFFLFELTDAEMKVVVMLEDKSHLPICYVSDPYDPAFEGIQIAVATCGQHLLDCDIICTFIGDSPVFYRVHVTGAGPSVALAEGSFNENAIQSFLTRNQTIMNELKNYLITDISRRSKHEIIPFDQAVKICSALVNVNYLQDESLLKYLQQVFARSSHYISRLS